MHVTEIVVCDKRSSSNPTCKSWSSEVPQVTWIIFKTCFYSQDTGAPLFRFFVFVGGCSEPSSSSKPKDYNFSKVVYKFTYDNRNVSLMTSLYQSVNCMIVFFKVNSIWHYTSVIFPRSLFQDKRPSEKPGCCWCLSALWLYNSLLTVLWSLLIRSALFWTLHRLFPLYSSFSHFISDSIGY